MAFRNCLIVPKKDFSDEAEIDSAQQAWRAKATQAVLWVVAIVGLPLLLLAVSNVFVELPFGGRLVALGVYVVLLAVLFMRRTPYRVRATVLLSALYALSATQLAVGGLAGQGRIGLVLFPVLAMVLLGLRAGWIAFAVSALMMAVSVALSWAGMFAHGQAIPTGDFLPRYWTFQGVTLLMPLLVVMILLTQFLKLQNLIMTTERQTRRKLENEIATRRQCEAEIARVGEDERRRLGSDLHDGLCQQLTAALLNCTAAENQLAAKNLPEAGLIGQLRSILEGAIGMSYDVSKGLCPVELDPEGLTAALERLARQTQTSAGVPCRLRSEGAVAVRNPQAALNLFRIAQEAVANAVKHAHCRAIEIDLQATADALVLRVRDDGVGQDASPNSTIGGMGLRLMAHRAETLGGVLTVEPAAGGGTAVICRIPAKNEGATAR